MSEGTSKPSSGRLTAIAPIIIVLLLVAVFAKRLIDVQDGLDPNQVKSVLLDTPVPDIDLPPLPERGPGLATENLKGEVTLILGPFEDQEEAERKDILRGQ